MQVGVIIGAVGRCWIMQGSSDLGKGLVEFRVCGKNGGSKYRVRGLHKEGSKGDNH